MDSKYIYISIYKLGSFMFIIKPLFSKDWAVPTCKLNCRWFCSICSRNYNHVFVSKSFL